MSKFSDAIRSKRIGLGVHMAEIGDRLNISASMYGRIERGEIPPFNEDFQEICGLFGLDTKVYADEIAQQRLSR